METKYTEGKWDYEFNNSDSFRLFSIIEGRDKSIFDIIKINNEKLFDESEANINLMSAAPELLKALGKIANEARIMSLGESSDYVKISIDTINESIKLIKKVIT